MSTSNHIAIFFTATTAADLEELISIRIAAMRPSLERVGRFDPLRARQRFQSGFVAADTRFIVHEGHRVGFVVVKHQGEHLLLDHLYITPLHQGKGIGAAVLASIFNDADAAGLPLRVGALKQSEANRFYRRHGFEQVEEAQWDVYYLRPPHGASPPKTQAGPCSETVTPGRVLLQSAQEGNHE